MRAGIGARVVVVAMLLGGLLGGTDAPAMARGRRCTVQGTQAADVLPGSGSSDRVCAKAGNDSIESLGGNDVIWSGKGNDTVEGDSGNDRIFGGSGNDTLEGNTGTDVVRGGPGDDVIHVTDGDSGDRAIGGKETDTCFVNQADVARGCEQVHVVA
jgi:Ca2+-binding RTX toxin-like protein